MGEEMQGVEGDTGWRKAIPEGRDRLQSRVLVRVVGALLVWLSVDVLHTAKAFWDTVSCLRIESLCAERGVGFHWGGDCGGNGRGSCCAGRHDHAFVVSVTFFDCDLDDIRCAIRTYSPLVSLFLITFPATRASDGNRRLSTGSRRRGSRAAPVVANLSGSQRQTCVSFRVTRIVA